MVWWVLAQHLSTFPRGPHVTQSHYLQKQWITILPMIAAPCGLTTPCWTAQQSNSTLQPFSLWWALNSKGHRPQMAVGFILKRKRHLQKMRKKYIGAHRSWCSTPSIKTKRLPCKTLTLGIIYWSMYIPHSLQPTLLAALVCKDHHAGSPFH